MILAKDTRDHTPHQSASYFFDTFNQNVDNLAQSGIEAKERVTFTDYFVEVKVILNNKQKLYKQRYKPAALK